MKTSAANGYQGFYWGGLADTEQAYRTYAQYLANAMKQYNDMGIRIRYLSLQNEPLNEPNDYPVMRMSAQSQARLAAHLGPVLEQMSLAGQVKVVVYDHNWDQANYPVHVLSNQTARQFVAGSAFHCYAGQVSNQSLVHAAFPDKEVYLTECSGYGADDFSGNLQWNTRNLYIGAVDNWASMVMHWNLALDQNSGPHNGGCANCRGIVTIDTASLSVTKNSEFYGLAMFGKYVGASEGATKRVRSKVTGSASACVEVLTMLSSDASLVATVANFCQYSVQTVAVYRASLDSYVLISAPAGLSTIHWST